jgi:hypothetical protein
MSVAIAVYFDSRKLVSAHEWNKAIKDFGFEMELDTDFDAESHSGFLPCKYQGDESGFEYYYTQELDGIEDIESDIVGARNAATEFITHSDLKELATSVIAASVLCKLTDGVLFDDGNWVVAEQAIDWGKEQIGEIQQHIK